MLCNPLAEIQAAGNLRALRRRRRNMVVSKLRETAQR
jgi:hypothetical protein